MIEKNDPNYNDFFMKKALLLAEKARDEGEIPVGALILDNDGIIISEAYNLREKQQRSTAHAEILAIDEACKKLNRWRLHDCSLFVTLEPCFMCAGAIILARIPRVVFATKDPKAGAVVSLAQVLNDSRLNHQCEVISGISENEASLLLKKFFKQLRK